jgi:hypothetical protein
LIDAVPEHRIQFSVRADDNVQVWMNGIANELVAPQYGRFRSTDATPIQVNQPGQDFLVPGRNCLYVMVEDTAYITGFNLQGRVTGALATPASGVGMDFSPCCDEVNGGSANAAAPVSPSSLSAAEAELVSRMQEQFSNRKAPTE